MPLFQSLPVVATDVEGCVRGLGGPGHPQAVFFWINAARRLIVADAARTAGGKAAEGAWPDERGRAGQAAAGGGSGAGEAHWGGVARQLTGINREQSLLDARVLVQTGAD